MTPKRNDLEACDFCSGLGTRMERVTATETTMTVACPYCYGTGRTPPPITPPNAEQEQEKGKSSDLIAEKNPETHVDGSPDWTCSACGSKSGFTTVKNGNPMDIQDYDLQCDSCGSIHVYESEIEALREAIDVNESYLDEVIGLKEQIQARESQLQSQEERIKELEGALVDIRDLCQITGATYEDRAFEAEEIALKALASLSKKVPNE